MQQFRPLPRFDSLEDAEPVDMPSASATGPRPVYPEQPQIAQTRPQFVTSTNPQFVTTNALLATTHPQFVTTDALPATTRPQFAAPNPQFVTTDALPAATRPQFATTNPRFAAQRPQSPPAAAPQTGPQPAQPARTMAQMPTVLLGDSISPPDTGKPAALSGKPLATGKHPNLAVALQATMTKNAGLPGATSSRLVVIPGAKKKKKTGKAARRLNPRLRQAVVLLTLLIVVVCTLTTLVPLSDSQNSANIFSNIGGWLHSVQLDWNIQAHQEIETFPTELNGPSLPYMNIASSPYVAVAEQDAKAAGIPFVYFVRQIQQESGFNVSAVSVTNAEGIAQFEPSTAAEWGVNPWDPNSALLGASRLMAKSYHQYGNYAKALGAYNAGSGAVQGAVYSCGMYWLSCMPGQTQDYVYRIMGV